MVVVEGPRFSTRAESQHYAAQGWYLVNMTGAPEAALARELRMCYAAIALVTDMDAGVEPGRGRRPGGGVRAVRGQPRAAHAACSADAIAALPDPDGCSCSTWADGIDLTYEIPMRVLLTGSAGFIGAAIGRRARGRRPRGRPRRPDAAAGARRGRRGAGRDAPARRPRRRRLGRPAATASTWSATRPRWSAPASRSADLPDCTPPTTTSAPPRCWRRCTTPGVARLVLASSMVVYGEGRYACAEHGDQVPPPRSRAALDAGDFDNHCAVCGGALGWALVDEDARLDPRSGVRRQQGRPGALRLGLGPPGRRGGGRAALPQRLRAAACRGTRRTPAWPRCSAPRSSAARRRRSSRTAARCATSCTSPTSPAPTWLRCEAVAERPRGRAAAYNVCSGHPVSIRDVADAGRRAAPAVELAPVVTGGYRLGDVRHVVASPARAASELGFTRRRCCRRATGSAAPSRTAPLRALTTLRSPARVEQVLDDQRGERPAAPSPDRRQRSGSSAQ